MRTTLGVSGVHPNHRRRQTTLGIRRVVANYSTDALHLPYWREADETLCCETLWCETLWCETLWCETLWCDTLWCETLWCETLCHRAPTDMSLACLSRVSHSQLVEVSPRVQSCIINLYNYTMKNSLSLSDCLFRTKTFLEPSGCRTRSPGRTWLLEPVACSSTNHNAPFCSR